MKVVLSILAVLLAAVLTVAGGFYWAWRELRTPFNLERTRILIDIPRGLTPGETVARLERAHVIRNGLPLKLYIKLKELGPTIKAGSYSFQTPMTPLEVLRELQTGQQGFNRLTVIEGWTRWDIAQAMARLPALKLRNADEALAFMSEKSLIADLDPKAENLEGYLFPDTYFVVPGTDAKEMVAQMVRRFRQIWRDKLEKHAAKKGRSAHEVVTAASIIETEAKLKGERPLVASVIRNRLSRGMTLSMDSTVVYASKLAGKWRNDGKVYQSDLDLPSPYNTRKYQGLPPGPVGSPGLPSLLAALTPAESDYLYYVRNPARNDGAHNFYKDDGSFSQGVQALRAWERARDHGAVKRSVNKPAGKPAGKPVNKAVNKPADRKN